MSILYRKKMNFFNLDEISIEISPEEPTELMTPIGKLLFSASVNGTAFSPVKKTASHCGSNFVGLSWYTNDYTAEFVRLAFQPKLPPDMSVDGCIAAIWRMRCTKDGLIPKFTCSWIDPPHNLVGFPETGEGIDAQSWEHDSCKLVIGTYDGERLVDYATQGEKLPQRLRPLLSDNSCYPIEYLPNGMRISYPPLQSNEFVQAHFVISWTTKSSQSSSAWFAVDSFEG